jgi:hypothetical protein
VGDDHMRDARRNKENIAGLNGDRQVVTAQRRTLYIVVGNRHIGIRLTKGNEWCEFGGG